MGSARWWWNYALNLCNQTYEQTGKGLNRTALNKVLPSLKKADETKWLGECYSQVLQSTTLNLTRAFKNFFEKRAKYPRFKSYRGKQSAQYPQNCQVLNQAIKVPQVGVIRASIHRLFQGKLKTVTITKSPSGKFYASLLFDTEQDFPEVKLSGKVIGIDLGITDFAVTYDGEKISKYSNPKHLARHEDNLARKQFLLTRKEPGSKSREKTRKLLAKVYERLSNARQDFLHKLSRKVVDNNQVVVVENLNVRNAPPLASLNRIQARSAVKGMVRNRKLAKAISNVGWGTFTNFLDYKLKLKGGLLVEIDRFFPLEAISCEYRSS